MSNCSNVKNLRLSKGWSQEQLAQLANLNVRTIQRIENGENGSLETLGALSAVLGLNANELAHKDCKSLHNKTEGLNHQLESARHQAFEESRLIKNLIRLVIFSVIIFMINLAATPHTWWFYWPILGWFLAIIGRYITLSLIGQKLNNWEQKRTQSLLKKNKSEN